MAKARRSPRQVGQSPEGNDLIFAPLSPEGGEGKKWGPETGGGPRPFGEPDRSRFLIALERAAQSCKSCV